MEKTKLVNFNEKAMFDRMMKTVIAEQNIRLINYAKELIEKIGAQIQTYQSRHHMDRTGNLLDSLCWGVSYEGKLVEGGFYREKKASRDSYLHEWWSDQDERYLYPVNGRLFAEEYLNHYGNRGEGKGWRVFVAILAPYWGFWENGFVMIHGFSNNGGNSHFRGATFKQFAVMTQFFDVVKKELKPARVRFRHPVSKYTRKAIEKRREKYYDRDFNLYKYGKKNLK